jgi:DNA polymerase III subunit delta'
MIGHDQLKTQLEQNRAHSVVLEGVARVGRRVVARWYAQRLNCREPNGLEPCGVCPSCQNFLAGSHPDYLEISPREETSTGRKARASLIPIGAISKAHDTTKDFETHVLDFVELGPRYRHKVVVFDGAEFLNESAANALLKSVEEPLHGAKFMFITEDISGVIPTIVSRSVRYRVKPVPDAILERLLPTPDPMLLAFAAGRPGIVLEREKILEALEQARAFLHAVRQDLLDGLTAADQLEKKFDRFITPDALRFALRELPASERVKADAALEKTRQALEKYATPNVAFSSLALEWRKALGRNED